MKVFQHIAVASTFSPRFLPLLAEAKTFVDTLQSDMSVIHVGARNAESEKNFADAFAQLGIDAQVHWKAGAPVPAILQCVNAEKIDLLIAGALERQTEGRHFLGHVSRVLMRDAPCSLLFFTKPAQPARPIRKIAVITDFSELSRESLLVAIDLAERCGAAKIHVLRVFTVFAQVLANPHEINAGGESGSSALAREEVRLEHFVAGIGGSKIPLETRCIEGTTGFAASDYVQSIGIDLLVIAAGPPSADEVFPAQMEWLSNVIPSNLLVYRPR